MSTIDLETQLQNAAGATEVILVFVTVLFGIRYAVITEKLKEQYALDDTRWADQVSDFIKCLIRDCMPLLVVNGICSYLYGPLAGRIIRTSQFSLLEFDFTLTAFLFVWLLVCGFWLWAFALSWLLLVKIGKKITSRVQLCALWVVLFVFCAIPVLGIIAAFIRVEPDR